MISYVNTFRVNLKKKWRLNQSTISCPVKTWGLSCSRTYNGKISAATVMGSAIARMHYTAMMAAVSFQHTPQ